jgi:hypothetical protein
VSSSEHERCFGEAGFGLGTTERGRLAALAMTRDLIANGRYGYHISGEDVAFANDVDRFGFRTGWVTDLVARHVLDPSQLERAWDVKDRALGAP